MVSSDLYTDRQQEYTEPTMTPLTRSRAVASLAAIAVLAVLLIASPPAGADEGSVGETPVAGSITAGDAHTCAILTNGTVKCWGANAVGQLGYGDTNARGDQPGEMAALKPVDFGGTRTAKGITTGDTHTCVLTQTDKVKCWGQNNFGQLGYGDFIVRGDGPGEMGNALPTVNLGTGRTAAALVAGPQHSCALLTDGAVKCWGRNTSGTLGLGDQVNRGDGAGEMGNALPVVNLGTGRTAVALGAGDIHTCAILDNGRVKCWGEAQNGQLGYGDTNDRGDEAGEMGDALPYVDLGTGRTAVAISAGDTHTCALLDNGAVKCWGSNGFGQLGQGDIVQRGDGPGEMGNALAAVNLGSGRTAVAISTSVNHNCAVLDNGTLKCWGRNASGQLGVGDTANRGDNPGEMGNALPAAKLGAGRTALAVTTGNNHTCAVLDDSTLRCWGDNQFGQLGIGSKQTVDQPDKPKDPVDLGPDDSVGPPAPYVIPACDDSDKGFTDIATSFARLDINCLNDIGVINGTTPTTYSPLDDVTREQAAALMGRLWRVLGGVCLADDHPFVDVRPTSYARADIGCLVELDVIRGTSPTTYSPNDTLTREQAAALIGRLWRAYGGTCSATTHPFTDVRPDSYARLDIACLVDLGIIKGTSPTTYTPTRELNRQEAAALMARLYRAVRAL